jgi:hypothetical protein
VDKIKINAVRREKIGRLPACTFLMRGYIKRYGFLKSVLGTNPDLSDATHLNDIISFPHQDIIPSPYYFYSFVPFPYILPQVPLIARPVK